MAMLNNQRVNKRTVSQKVFESPSYGCRDCTGAPLGHVAKGGQDQLHTDVGHDEGHAVPRLTRDGKKGGCLWIFNLFI